MKGFEDDGYRRKGSGLSHQLHSADYYSEGVDAHSTGSLIEVECAY